MSFLIARLNATDAATVWPKVEPFLAPAIARCRALYTPDDVRDLVTQPGSGGPDAWSLWICCEGDRLLGAWTSSPHYYPRCKVLDLCFAGGREMSRYFEFAGAETEKFARENGFYSLRGGGRRGWGRLGMRFVGWMWERVL